MWMVSGSNKYGNKKCFSGFYPFEHKGILPYCVNTNFMSWLSKRLNEEELLIQ